MIKTYISNFHDVYTNIAIERYLFKHSKDDLILFLWWNNPCVVFGRNQNIYNEVNIEYAKNHNIALARRFSGGGAVYQDLGNLNYTFIYKDENDIFKINDILIKTFTNLGLDVYFSERNDLLINDKKFSGLAFCYDFDHVMYHGTCLVNVKTDELVNVLKPHEYKLKSHSVSSYKSRVINLHDIKDITIKDVINSFLDILNKDEDMEYIKDIALNEEIKEIKHKLEDENFIYNDSPSFTYQLDIRLNNSNYNFEIEYKDGIIIDAVVYCDDLNTEKIDFYKEKLLGKRIQFNDLNEYLSKL